MQPGPPHHRPAPWPPPGADACVCARLLSRPFKLFSNFNHQLEPCSHMLVCNSVILNTFRCVGAGTHVRKCIIDKNARIGSNVRIVNEAGVREANREEEGFVIKDGIVVVIKDTIIPDGTVI